MSLRSTRTGISTRTCIFPRWKNLASWLIVRQSPRSDHGQGRILRPEPDDGTRPRTPRTRLPRLIQTLFYQCLSKVSKTIYSHHQRPLRAACHRACRARAHILHQQQPTSSCALLAARRRSTALFSSSQVARRTFACGWPPEVILW